MSHAALLMQGVALEDPAHERIAQQRLRDVQRDHAKRIMNVLLEKRIVTGDIWKGQPEDDERRITMDTGHRIVSLGAGLLFPKPPAVHVQPLDASREKDADLVQKFVVAALDKMNAYNTFRYAAKETMFGVGGIHMTPWKYAMDGEVPVIMDAPESGAILYRMGPQGRLDYVFIKHRLTVRDIQRDLGVTPGNTKRDEGEQIDVWCYYAEERYIDPATGQVNKMILYTCMEQEQFIFPLKDMTRIMPNLPVFLAFNSDGYAWKGQEHMRGMGILTPVQQRLLYASDFMTQLANGMIRFIDPPLALKRGMGSGLTELDLRSGAQNILQNDDSVEPLAGKPDPQSMAYWQNLMSGIADSSYPQIYQQQQSRAFGQVSGAALAEQSEPLDVHNNLRQLSFEYMLRDVVDTMVQHLANVISPQTGLQIVGVNRRDNKMYAPLIHPDILKGMLIDIRLSRQMPRDAVRYINLIQQLGRDGMLPESMVTEQAIELLDLPAPDMTTVRDQIQYDRMMKVKMEMLSQQMIPHLQASMGNNQLNYNQMQNPQIGQSGTRPIQLPAQDQDPRLLEDVTPQGPMQQRARLAAGVSY